MPTKLTAAIEIVGYILATLLSTLLAAFNVISVDACIWITIFILISLLFLAWYRFDGGRHPCFLFLGTLIVFQAGRLLAHVCGVMQDPMQIDVGTPVAIHVPDGTAEVTLFVLVLSAVLVYAPCRLSYQPVLYKTHRETDWLPALYSLIVVTFPFSLYKNVAYFAYLRAHGGYLAVYTDNAAVLATAGPVVRIISLIGTSAILLAYVVERRPKRLGALLILYFALSIFDLLIGFRGKFFSQCLGLWFLNKLKSGRRFNMIPLVVTGIVVAVASVVAGAFREEHSVTTLNPIIFVAVQGVSLNVTEAAVMYSDIFSRFGASYIFWGFFYNIVHAPDIPHILWSGDLSVFLNPAHAEMGFGTATSYLAELYLLGGIGGVIVGSILVGFSFRGLHRISSQTAGAVTLAFLLPAMIYLPRVELLYPLAIAAKSLMSLIPISIYIFLFRSTAVPIHRLLRGQTVSAPGEGE